MCVICQLLEAGLLLFWDEQRLDGANKGGQWDDFNEDTV